MSKAINHIKKRVIVITLLTILVTVISIITIYLLSTPKKYADCYFYLGYNQEDEQYPVVYWLVNQENHSYISYQDFSDEYHSSCFILNGDNGEIKEMSLTLDGRGKLYQINVLTVICNDVFVSYYPQEIIEKFSIIGAQDFFITDGLLFIQTTDQDCTLALSEDFCEHLNMLRII